MSDYHSIILNSIADGIFTVDLEYKITSMNHAAEEILGITEDEAIGNFCAEIFHASVCEHSCVLRETMNTGKNVINRTIYIVNANGDQIPISISTALLKDSRGKIIGGVESFRDISELVELRKSLEEGYTFQDIVSKSRAMREIFSILPDIAESDSTVLIEGASGTGKELIARALHNLSPRSGRPFVVVNCAALPEQLIESELFGYKAGAFTDARKDKPGKIARAEGGTLFIDEIGEVTPPIQVKLLRFIQDRIYEPLGGTKTIKADLRIVTATNRVLYDEVKAGNFREDLYYRLNVINLQLPPLSKRLEDIPLLVKHFIRRFNARQGKSIAGVSDEVMNILMNYDYPGNIRELENIIEHAFVLCRDEYIRLEHIPLHLRPKEPLPEIVTLEEMEKHHIKRTLKKNSWNRSNTAKELGIDKSTLWRKIKMYGITQEKI